jgi:hypothetical protein
VARVWVLWFRVSGQVTRVGRFGNTAMVSILEFLLLRNFDVPVMVPPVPTPEFA